MKCLKKNKKKTETPLSLSSPRYHSSLISEFNHFDLSDISLVEIIGLIPQPFLHVWYWQPLEDMGVAATMSRRHFVNKAYYVKGDIIFI